MPNLIPHFICDQYKNNIFQGESPAITMFMDISGFTPMTEMLMKEDIEGAEILSYILNNIFRLVIDAVYDSGGYISGFAGDAFTIIFLDVGHPIKPIYLARKIIEIFKQNKVQKTKFGDFELNVKIGLSYGQVEWGVLGKEEHKTYFYQGDAIEACANSEHKCNKMDIIIDKSLYKLLNKSFNIKATKSKNGNANYFKLKNIHITKNKPEQENSQNIISETEELSIEIVSKFIPETVIKHYNKDNLYSMGQFRNIVSVFISFRELLNFEELNQFITNILFNVKEFGGYFNGLDFGDKGNNILVFFGVPISYENNIWRAINFIQSLKIMYGDNIKAGITTGIVYSGFVGCSKRCTFTSIGDIVNLSARFMMRADWGSVWISEKINKKLKIYDSKYLGNKKIKGKSELIPVYALLEKKQKAKTIIFESEMVGRQYELDKLREYIKPLFDNKFGGLVYVYGEAGIGKSRLVNEFIHFFKDELQILVLQCDSILKKSMNPFVYTLNNYFRQLGLNSEKEKREMFDTIYDEIILHLENIVNTSNEEGLIEKTLSIKNELINIKSLLGALLDIHWKGSLYEQLDAKARFDKTIYAIKVFIKALSLFKPLVLFLEDLHWIDDDSQKVFQFTPNNIKDFPIIIIATTRFNDDGSKPSLKINDTILQNEIIINELKLNSIDKFITDRLGEKADDKLINFVYSKTLGNPFYIEEFIRYLKNSNLIKLIYDKTLEEPIYKIINENIEVPTNIKSIIVARIDRLTDEVKRVVFIAAVLGREFELKILYKLFENTSPKIQQYKFDGLILEGKNENIWYSLSGIKYLFKHALLQETIYEIQLKQRLRNLHKLAGGIIENIHQGESTYYSDIAYHFEKAGMVDKQKYYFEKAGDYAKDNFKNEEALKIYDKLLKLTIDKEKLIDIYFKKAEIFEVIAKWEQSIKMLNIGIELAIEIKNVKKEAELKTKFGRVLERKGDYNKAIFILESVMNFIESDQYLLSTDYKRIYANCLDNIAIVFYRQSDFNGSLKYHKKSLEIREKIDDKSGIAYCLNGIGVIYYNQGELDKSFDALYKSLKIREEIGGKIEIAICLNNIGLNYYKKDDYEKGLNYQKKSLNIYKEVGARDYCGYNYAYISYAYAKLKQYKPALNISLLHFKDIEEIGNYAEKGRTHLAVALILSDKNTFDKEEELLLKKISAITKLNKTPEVYFIKAIEIASEDNYLETLVPALYEYSIFLYQSGEKDKSEERIKEAREKALEDGMKGEIKKIDEICQELLHNTI